MSTEQPDLSIKTWKFKDRDGYGVFLSKPGDRPDEPGRLLFFAPARMAADHFAPHREAEAFVRGYRTAIASPIDDAQPIRRRHVGYTRMRPVEQAAKRAE